MNKKIKNLIFFSLSLLMIFELAFSNILTAEAAPTFNESPVVLSGMGITFNGTPNRKIDWTSYDGYSLTAGVATSAGNSDTVDGKHVGTLTNGKWCSTDGTTITCTNNSPLMSYTETDPTIYAWAKAATKPSYTFNEIGSGSISATTGYFSGNVGIGTTNPLHKLQVKPTTDINLLFGIGFDDATAGRITAINDASAGIPLEFRASKYNFTIGNVGIAKTNPGATLDVVGSGTFTGTVNGTGLCIGGDCKTSWAAVGSASSGWTQNGNEVYKTNTAGNVGIGTTGPGSKLEVSTTGVGQKTLLTLRNTNGAANDTADIDFWITSSTASPLARIGAIRTNRAVNADTDLIFSNYGNGLLSEKMRIKDNGNVGISKTNPGAALDVVGSGTFTGTVNGTGLCIGGDCKTSWAAVGAASSGWTQNGNEVYKTSTSGNVGIGTTSPTAKLEVAGGAWNTGIKINTNSTSGADLSLNNSGTSGRDYHITSTGSGNASGAGKLQFYDQTAAITRMVIDSSGNVGIGTTTPGQLLVLEKDQNAQTKFQVINVTSGASGQAAFQLSTDINGSYGIGAAALSSGFNLGAGYEELLPSSGTIGTASLMSNGLYLYTSHASAPIRFGTGGYAAGSEKMRIQPSGNVGIGTTAPSNKLDVSGGVGTTDLRFPQTGYITYNVLNSGSQSLIFRNYGTETMRITPGGAVGINKTAPAATLDVVGSGTFTGTVNGTGLCIGGDCKTSWAAVGAASSGWTQNGNEVYKTNTAGNVGMGTTAPGTKLHLVSSDPYLTLQGNNADYSNAGIQLIADGASNARALGTFYLQSVSGVEWFTGQPYGDADSFIIARKATSTPSSQSSPPGVTAQNINALFKITSAGNVGVGTVTPTSYFHGGTNKVLEIFNSGTATHSQSHLILGSGATTNVGSVGSITWVTPNSTSNKGVAYIGGVMTSSSVTNASGALTFATANAATPTERMRIDYTGNVGIMKTNPGAVLDVVGAINSNSTVNGTGLCIGGDCKTSWAAVGSASSGWTQNGAEVYKTNTSGNVGIGTTAPGNKLAVSGTNGASNDFSGYPGWSTGYTPNGAEIQFNINRPFTMGVNGATYRGGLSFGPGGVGIYSVNPNPSGSPYYGDMRFYNTYWNTDHYENIDRMIIAYSGNVGIAKASPVATLDVVGSGSFTGTVNGTGLCIGGDCKTSWAAVGAASSGWTQNGNEVYKTNTAGNVGIGTTAPGAPLEIKGGGIIINTGNHPGFKASSLNMDFSTTFSAARIQSGTGSSNLLLQPSGGVIGIGTTAPIASAKLTITEQDSNGSQLTLLNTRTGGNRYVLGVGDNGSGVVAPGAFFMYDIARSATDFTIKAGNVGIGTTDPESKLDIRTVAGGYNLGLSIGPDTVTDGDGGYILFKTSTTAGYGAKIGGVRSGTDAAADLIFSTGVASNSYPERMRINSVGNVGIAKTNPGATLDVVGSGTFTGTVNGTGLCIGGDCKTSWAAVGAASSGWSQNGAEVYKTNTAGNVGIGTTGPTNKLHVDTNGQDPVYISHTAPSIVLGDNAVYGSKVNSTVVALATTANNFLSGSALGDSIFAGKNNLLFGTGLNSGVANGTIRMVITSGGNVGIGTTAPDAKLDVLNGAIANTTSTYSAHYRNVLTTYINDGGSTGTMKIVLPKPADTMVDITIKGYDYSSIGAWEVRVSGYLYGGTGGGWYTNNHKVQIIGSAPFSKVRLAWDGSKPIILLGDTSTSWSYGSVVVSDFITSFRSVTGWSSGWTASVISSESGITTIATPTIYTYVTPAGNLGIGKTNPGANLDVAGAINAGSTINGTGLCIGGDCRASWAAAGSYWTGYGTNIGNNNAGNVGIGTTNPVSLLEISKPTGGAADLSINRSSNVNDYARLLFKTNGAIKWYIGMDKDIYPGSDKLMIYGPSGFYTTFDINGNVGIGTAAPDNSLTVKGTTLGAAGGKVSIYGGGDENTWTAARNEVLRLGRADILGSYYNSIWSSSGSSANENLHWLRFYISNANGSAQTLAMTMNGSGNVGIGKTGPDVSLDVLGAINAGSTVNGTGLCIGGDCKTSWAAVGSASSGWTQNGNEVYKTNTSGNVGIGTTAPGYKLDIRANNNGGAVSIWNTNAGVSAIAGIYFVNNNVNESPLIGYTSSAYTGYGGANTLIANASSRDFAIVNSSREVARFTNAGNVGIKTTSPTAPLDIFKAPSASLLDGALNFSSLSAGTAFWGFRLSPTTYDFNLDLNDGVVVGTAMTVQRASHNVGVGKTNPGAGLDVSGAINAGSTVNGTGLCIGGDCKTSWAAVGSASSGWTQNGNEVYKTNTAGNVGIGITNPTSLLQLMGASIGENLLANSASNVFILDSRSMAANVGGSITFGGSYTGTSPTRYAGIRGVKLNGTDGNYSGRLEFFTRNNADDDWTGDQRMVIDNLGNVGVGTTTPSAKLHIDAGNPTDAVGMYLDTTTGSGGSAAIGTGSSVGPYLVGNTKPDNTVRGAYAASKMKFDAGGFLFQTSDETTGTRAWDDRVKINIAGNVGIAKTNPTATLDTVGSGSFSSTVTGTGVCIGANCLTAWPWVNNSTNIYSNNSGNVGIGITNPSAKLHIVGGLILNRTAVGDTNYTALATDYIIAFTSLSVNRTLTLPNALCTPGRVFLISNETNSAYSVSIDPEGATLIVGMTNILLPAYNTTPVYCNGTNWYMY